MHFGAWHDILLQLYCTYCVVLCVFWWQTGISTAIGGHYRCPLDVRTMKGEYTSILLLLSATANTIKHNNKGSTRAPSADQTDIVT